MRESILTLDPDTYERHPIHSEERDWAETNCYVDVWIELLHALGHEPIAGLPFTFGLDFEGDQWTFFKYPISDLYALYGIDIQELNIWQSLIHQVEEQVRRGRPVLVEMDSYFLPDTQGTSYHAEHVKTTVAVNDIDIAGRHMGYFHAQGFYHLSDDDFVRVFRLGSEGEADGWLPPYVEFVKLDRGPVPKGEALIARSLALLREHVERRPASNPAAAFRERFGRDLEWLREGSLENYHQYSFATLRQVGAGFELAATYLRWLAASGHERFGPVADRFAELSTASKTLQFKLARVVGRKRDMDFSSVLDAMQTGWDESMSELIAVLD